MTQTLTDACIRNNIRHVGLYSHLDTMMTVIERKAILKKKWKCKTCLSKSKLSIVQKRHSNRDEELRFEKIIDAVLLHKDNK